MYEYEQALMEAERTGLARCGDAAAMAAYCEASLQLVVGAVSPRLVWEGAQKRGLTYKELVKWSADHPMRVVDLQWIE